MSDCPVRFAQSVFEEHYEQLLRSAASALRNRIRERPADRDELIQNTLAHVWQAWLSVCKRGAFQGLEPRHRLLRLVHWHAKLRRTFGHGFRNRWSWHDGSHGCIPIETVAQQVYAPLAIDKGQTVDCRQRVTETGEVVVSYRMTR